MKHATSLKRTSGYLLAGGTLLVKQRIKGICKRLFADNDGLARMRILAGPARGSWLLLDLAVEASYWVGTYDRRIIQEIAKHCSEGMTAYDCGAYIGYYTAVFASLVGSSGRVVTLEPDPRNYVRVQRQVGLNGWGHVQVLQAALGEGYTTVEFFESNVSTATSRIDGCYTGPEATSKHPMEDGKNVRVRSVSLDELVFEMGYPKPDFVKLDIEGAEYMALTHCKRVATEIRPIILVELHNPECDEAADAFVQKYGYDARNLGKEGGQNTLLLTPRGNRR